MASLFLYSFPAFKPIHCVGWVIFFWACLKTERLRWGSPTATAPFALFWLCPTAFVNLARDFSLVLTSVRFRVNPWLVFFFPFIDVGLFKERAVAMGKPHCNRSIRTFLVIAPTALVNLAQDFSLVLTSVRFRGKCFCCFSLFPCFCFCFFREIPCPSVANAFSCSSVYSSFREIPCHSVAGLYSFLPLFGAHQTT